MPSPHVSTDVTTDASTDAALTSTVGRTPRRPRALVTGASSGIGREFACQLAGRNHDLVLVARDTARLDALAQRLRSERGVEVEVLTADLSDRAAVQTVADRLTDDSRPVDLLVNNAGHGVRRSFVHNDLADEEAMFDVLTKAVLVLSHAAVQGMAARRHGAIINVSSVAGWIAFGTYSAAKSWVTVFTEGLAFELRGTGVTATALCPGYTTTEFQQRAGLGTAGPRFLWLDADRLVRDCLRDVARGSVVSVPGAQYKAVRALLAVAPRPLLRRRVRPGTRQAEH
ncbi:MAG: family NAD(P)-dependent oxidoreductase [Humibacillus sp.]|nr:family NAD(P)-dependent oxidoreductase [Humibacillus sp.]